MVSRSAGDKTMPASEPSELTTPVISTLPRDRSCRPDALVRVKGLEPPLPYGKQILGLPCLLCAHAPARFRSTLAPSMIPQGGAGLAHIIIAARIIRLKAGFAVRAPRLTRPALALVLCE